MMGDWWSKAMRPSSVPSVADVAAPAAAAGEASAATMRVAASAIELDAVLSELLDADLEGLESELGLRSAQFSLAASTSSEALSCAACDGEVRGEVRGDRTRVGEPRGDVMGDVMGDMKAWRAAVDGSQLASSATRSVDSHACSKRSSSSMLTAGSVVMFEKMVCICSGDTSGVSVRKSRLRPIGSMICWMRIWRSLM